LTRRLHEGPSGQLQRLRELMGKNNFRIARKIANLHTLQCAQLANGIFTRHGVGSGCIRHDVFSLLTLNSVFGVFQPCEYCLIEDFAFAKLRFVGAEILQFIQNSGFGDFDTLDQAKCRV
jgi:hypothetical protein